MELTWTEMGQSVDSFSNYFLNPYYMSDLPGWPLSPCLSSSPCYPWHPRMPGTRVLSFYVPKLSTNMSPAKFAFLLSVVSEGFGTSLVQWLRLRAPRAGGPGSTPGQGTRSHMPQLRVHTQQLKIPHTAMKTQCRQIKERKGRLCFWH